MGKQERLERKGDKSDNQHNQEVVELTDKNKVIFEQYLALKDDKTDAADKQRADLKKEFHDHYPFKDFEKALANYRAEHRPGDLGENRDGAPDTAPRAPGAPEGPGERREEVQRGTELELGELKKAIENYQSNEDNSLLAVQRLLDKGLTPVDLKTGNRQNDAIDAIFLRNNPNIAFTLKTGKYPGELNALSDSLARTFEKMRELKQGHEKFQEDVVTEFLGDKLGKIKNSIAENPIASLGALAAVLWAGKLVWDTGDTAKTWMKRIAGGTALVWGLNHFSGIMSNDGKSILSRLAWNASTFESNSVMRKHKGMLDTMNDSNRHAVDAMMHLGEARASAVAAAFENALRNGDTEINAYDIVGEGNLTPDEARMIHSKGMYIGLENLMSEIAKKKLGKDVDSMDPKLKAQTLHEALMYFKSHYASNGKDFKLFYILASLHTDSEPGKQNEDGSAAPGDPLYRGDGRELLNDSENAQVEKIENFFNSIGVEGVDVGGISGGYVTLNDYPFTVEIDKDTDTVTFIDTVDPTWKFDVTKNEAGKAEVIKAMAKIKDKINERLGGGDKVVYSKERKSWMLKDGLTLPLIAGMNVTPSSKLEVHPEVKKTGLRFILDGFSQAHYTLDAAKIALRKAEAQKKINEDLKYLLGDLTLIVEDTNSAPAFAVKYGDKLGTVKYLNGAIILLDLPENDTLMSAYKNRANAEAASYLERQDVKTTFSDLEAAFEGQWSKGGVLKPFERLSAIASNKWYGETPVFYDREAFWAETVGFKKHEIQMAIQVALLQAMREQPLPMNTSEYEARISRAITDMHSQMQTLKVRAAEISGMNLADGAALENALVNEAKKLDTFGYKSPDYVQFVIDLENLMAEDGYDFVGVEQFAHARKIRDEIRLSLLDYSNGIAFEDQSALTAQEKQKRKDYLVYLLPQVRDTFNDAQYQKDKGKGWMDFTDANISHSSFIEALTRRGVKRYSEFDAKYFAAPGVVPPLTSMPLGAGTAIETAGDKMENFKSELDKRFEPVEDMEWAWGATQFQVFVGLYKARYIETYKEVLQNPIVGPVQKEPDVELLERLDRDLLDLAALASSPTAGSKPHLKEVERVINKNMLDNPEQWATPAFEVLEFLSGKYEFENILQINQPSIWESYLKIYYSKINYGENSADAKDAQAYTDFFVFEMSKLLSQDKNIAIDNLDWDKISESMRDWERNAPLVNQIPSFDEWLLTRTTRPRVEFLDRETAATENVEEEKRAAAAEFMKGFDREIDVAQMMRIDGEWPDLFRRHTEERVMMDLYPKAATTEEFKAELNEFGKFLMVERQFYDSLIFKGTATDERTYEFSLPAFIGVPITFQYGSTLDVRLKNLIDEKYQTHFHQSPKNLNGFAQDLQKEATAMIDSVTGRSNGIYPFDVPSIGVGIPDQINFFNY